jgi:hypothetical protein
MVDGYVVADGFTGEIKETGGEGIPRNRDEDVYGDKFKPIVRVAAEPAKVKVLPAVEKQREPITPEKAKSIWTAFQRNEDDNDHSANAVLLARNFGTEQDLANALEIQSRHNKEGHLTSELSKRRDEIQDRLYPELLRLIQPAVEKPAEKKPMGKAYITKTIDRLKVALKYAPNPDAVKKQIKTLEIALKYS